MIRLLVLLALVLAVWSLVRVLLMPRTGGTMGGPWDPHAILGVPRDAPREEIARAYREQMKQYHPDRVADLGPELQQVAHRKTLEIQRAYEELTRG